MAAPDAGPSAGRGFVKRLAAGLGRLPVLNSPAARDPDYRRLWAGVACNHFAMSGEQVILGLLIFEITQSTAWVGASLAIYYLPLAVLGVFSGAVADWMDRRRLLRRIELGLATNLLLFAGLTLAGFGALWLLLAFSLSAGSLRALHQPARSSYAYDIVGGEAVVAGLGLLQLGSRFGQLLGALLSGAAMQGFGTPAAVLILAASHLLSYGLFCNLRSAGLAASILPVPLRQNLGEYWQELRRNRVLLMLVVLTAAVEVFGFSFSTALPELASKRFDVGAQGLGSMHAARATGGIIAGLALAAMVGPKRPGMVYLVVIYGFGASLLLLAAAPLFSLTLMALVLVAGLTAASDVLTQSMMQLSVANHLRGRAMGVWSFAIGAAPLGHLEMGALAVSIGVGWALLANGCALIAVAAIATLAVPRLRRL